MKTERLVNPIIIYWDIDPSLSEDFIDNICRDILAMKIFILCLRDFSPAPNKTTVSILNNLAGKNIKLRLTVEDSFIDQLHMGMFRAFKQARFYINFDSLEGINRKLRDIERLINSGYSAGISFYLNEKNFREIPDVVSLCIKNNIRFLEFPIQRADNEEKIFYLSPHDASRLSEIAGEIDLDKIELTIHDPFIWELFHKKDKSKWEGCNGALTMLYISEDLKVMPCPLIPVEVGNLRSSSLKEICLSKERQKIREKLSAPPYKCRDCFIVNTCNGGCRGRAYVLFNGFDKRDPACSA
ncbi:MAG: SPASM domain-containing protein [Nitrospirae bacterium]|nr:SPASM domain-containing protein [Nitrospirota bacterium]